MSFARGARKISYLVISHSSLHAYPKTLLSTILSHKYRYYVYKKKDAPLNMLMILIKNSINIFQTVIMKNFKLSFISDQSQVCIFNRIGARARQGIKPLCLNAALCNCKNEIGNLFIQPMPYPNKKDRNSRSAPNSNFQGIFKFNNLEF